MATGTSAIQRTRWGSLRLALITTVGILIGLLLLYTVEPLYIVDTIGTQKAVQREVPLLQRLICTQHFVFGTADSVLIREVSLQ